MDDKPQNNVGGVVRNHAFDVLCGICIIRMIMLHVTSECALNSTPWWQELMHWSYFFMSFFFFKAGYFNKTVAGDSRAFITGKAKSLMIPYFVWGFIGSCIYMLFVIFFLSAKNHYVKAVTWDHLWTTSGWHGNYPVWFLFCFFSAYVFMHLISKAPSLAIPRGHNKSFRIKIHWIVLIFPWISYWLYTQGNPLWLNLNNVFWGIFLFFLGRLWHVILDKLRRRNGFILSAILLAGFIVINFFDRGSYNMATNLWTEGTFAVTFTKTILSLCGLSGVFITIHIPAIPVLSYIGKHSMVYFVGHYPLIMFYKMAKSANVRTLSHHWDDWFILIVFIFIILTLLVPHVERIPWLSGKWPKKKN